jgi:hypothetical protein
LIAVFGLAASSALAADSVTRASFADGTWNGTSRWSTSIQGVSLSATATFAIRVRGGRVTGLLRSNGTAKGSAQGQSITAQMIGRYPVSGRSSAPVGRGALRISGRVGGKTQSAAGQVVVAFARLRGTCDRMAGQLVMRAADQSASGDTINSPFVATRVKGSGPRC